MKCIASRDDLLSALKLAAKVADLRGNIPILACVHMAAADSVLTITATDIDNTFSAKLASTPAIAGALAVPLKPFLAFVKAAAKGAQVEIEAMPAAEGAAPTVALRSGRALATLDGQLATDFPWPAFDDPATFTVPMNTLADMIAAVKYAISTETTRYYLNGVYMHRPKDRLVFVATDGYRIAKIETDKAGGPALDRIAGLAGVIVNAAAVHFLTGWLNPKNAWDVSVSIAANKGRVRFAHGGVALTAKTIDGSFPDYELVIPTTNTINVEIATAVALDFVNGHKCAVTLDCVPGSVALQVNNPDTGIASTELDASVSAPVKIGFNARYLKAELERAGKGPYATLNMALTDARSPAVLTSRDRPGELHVLMPMCV